MAEMGRPRIPIDKKNFESLCMLQCTKEEIAAFFDCSDDTVNNWCKENYVDENGEPMTFSAIFKIKSAGGKMSLRRLQWKSAQKGNVPMQIFLGKNWLGQSDKAEVEIPDTTFNFNIKPASERPIEEE
ncbi:MAG: hypothetical protein IKK84_00300 [Clostridia bacterium]|nr:hypothetical protein [Clostridia bacterium]